MANDPCDVLQLVNGLQKDFKQLTQQKSHMFCDASAFIDQCLPDEIIRKRIDSVPIDFSDDSSSDEEPVRMRRMALCHPPFDVSIKPEKKKKEKKEEVIEPPPPPLKELIKPVYLSTGVQKKISSHSIFTQTEVEEEAPKAPPVTYESVGVRTKQKKYKHLATNTEGILPSYERVCMDFLESLLNDAPIFASSSPQPETLERILLEFVDKLIQDAQNFEAPSKSISNTGIDHHDNVSIPYRKQEEFIPNKPKYSTIETQAENQLNTVATQSFVTLKSLERPAAIFNFVPPPKYDFIGEKTNMATLFEKWPQRKHVRVEKGETFYFPPSLKTQTPERKSIKTESTSPIPKTPTRDKSIATEKKPSLANIEELKGYDVSIAPKQTIPEHNISQQPIYIPQEIPPQEQIINQDPIIPPQAPKPLPKLEPFILKPLMEDIEELSAFNLETLMEGLSSSSDDEIGGTTTDITSDVISSDLNVSSGVIDDVSSDNIHLSDGEIGDDSFEISSASSRSFSSAESASGEQVWNWGKSKNRK